MKIQKLILYKTSLDNEYKNVIDTDPETKLNKTSYKEKVLDAYYSPLQIYNGETKAIQESDGGCVISISKEYEDIMNSDYNYAAIYTGRQWIFYFITSMSSLNDSNNPSMLIELERDAWGNNIEYLTDHNETDAQQVIRCHQSRIYDGGDNLFYPYYVPSNDNSSFATYVEENIYHIGGGGSVIWCGVRFSKDAIVQGSAGVAIASILTTIFKTITGLSTVYSVADIIKKISGGMGLIDALKTTIEDANDLKKILDAGGWKTIRDLSMNGGIPFESGAPVFYFPVGVLYGINDGVPDISLKFSCVYNGGTPFTYDFSKAGTINKLFNFESEEIIESFLTIIPPFTYSVSNSTVYVNNVITGTNPIRNSSATNYIFPYTSDGSNTFPYIYVAYNINDYKKITYTYKSPLYGFSATDSIGSVYFNPYESYENVKTFEPRIYCSPFSKLFVSIGQADVEIPIVQDRIKVDSVLLYGNKSEPMLSVLLNGKMVSSYNNIGTAGNLPTSYDKWKDFLLSSAIGMGSSIIGHVPSPPTTSQSSTTKTFTKHSDPTTVVGRRKAKGARLQTMSITTPGDITRTNKVDKTSTSGISDWKGDLAMGAASGLMSATQEGTSIMGQATRPTVPSNKGNNNIENFFFKIVKETFTDIKELYDVLGELYLYGYRYPEVQSIKSNNRVWFDYCETTMCSLPLIKNYRDREILESAFDRGITKWHYGPYGLQHNFLRNLNNVERKYISPIDAQYYFDFTKDDGTAMENRGTLGNVNVNWGNSYTQNNNGLSSNVSHPYGIYFTMVEPEDTIGYGNTYTMALKLGAKTITTTETYAHRKGILRQSRYGDNDPCYPIVSYDETNDKFSFCGNSTSLTWNDVQGKTITVSYFNAGGSYYGCYVSVFLDGTPIFENLNWGAVSHRYMKFISFLPNYTGGYVEKFAMWLDGAGNHVWDATKASQHLI